VGARLASRAGYDPNGLITFFKKLEVMQGTSPSILKYLMGHPPPADRQEHIRALIASEHLAIGVTNADAFLRMRARLPAGIPTAEPGR
jgi:predicted Zn-dependent protease